MTTQTGIYCCTHCKHIGEVPDAAAPQTRCARCHSTVTAHPAVQFVQLLLRRCRALSVELHTLKQQEAETFQAAAATPSQTAEKTAPAPQQAASAPTATAPASPRTECGQTGDMPPTDPNGKVYIAPQAGNMLAGINFHDTTLLTDAKQHAKISQWFAARKVRVHFDYAQMDTTGHYDEAALILAEHYGLYRKILEKTEGAYSSNHPTVNFNLKAFGTEERQLINNTFRKLFSQGLFAGYNFFKDEQSLLLHLSAAEHDRRFFCGGWRDWYALSVILENAKARGLPYVFSCAHTSRIRFEDGKTYELDVTLLPQGKTAPIIVGCQASNPGEYQTLRTRLDLPPEHLILLTPDLDDEQTRSLGEMYGLTFANFQTFAQHLAKVM